nr:reverse transcriptase domain-containing protein [Tanacetum cinerariifolium]
LHTRARVPISSSEDSDQTEPFEEGETAATPPPSAYRVIARIFVRPHIPMPFHLESEVERLLSIPTPPLSLVSPTSYPLPPFLMPLPIFTPLPPPPPIILPRTKASMKRARFTTPTGGYEVDESSVAATARQIRPALTVDDSRRAEDRLIGILRRERRYFSPCLPLIRRRLLTLVIIVLRSWTTASHERGEIKKLEVELWNLKVKGTDITSYTLRFQELALLCRRRFPEESDEIERYVGGLPEIIWGNVMSYETKSMPKAIEFANDQMDQKLLRIADRQADNKRKFDNTSRNQQNQQPFKRNNNVARAYAVGSGEKNHMEEPNLYALNATSTMMDHVVPNVPTARGLAI